MVGSHGDADRRLAMDDLLGGTGIAYQALHRRGPEDLSPSQMAATMSDVLGRPVRYRRERFDDYAARLSTYGMSAAFVRDMVDMMRAKDDGLDGGVARTPGSLPTSFRTWCEVELAPAVRALAA